jgi:hypothetical protein
VWDNAYGANWRAMGCRTGGSHWRRRIRFFPGRGWASRSMTFGCVLHPPVGHNRLDRSSHTIW